ncbi:50S ribosomal protein L39e [Sulfolobus acidocaldarius]|uniref:Large ribosomal subunit protein eL39 n=4 Tax=Sulfolobus acidocaldarius TaxID=2285 RepID=RL39_SULAC|nr:50S ribosomal protein L39e [Sulfolobus acidocaldarius]P13005.2 RecName: Full=Large ribosomal subunit protein eL39; AltName: Full=50S ribosomal protein L39e; AltName: Full=L46e [Sulfolobus acidocaldarius DSM 639]pir/R6UC46/ ribosomal protein L39.eR - Sulfolobus solfataricus [Saccharolobus solfataricus]AHC51705.1 50S ribosomal protein L39 [Sulfolobus acidocaldarius SUSAZ]ALU30657.1 50S ribosomal protein L39 [Sulfolobus acidocaldarius]ALU32747.1 50S ribosomal protein L39 [Sulfolobus acidocalda
MSKHKSLGKKLRLGKALKRNSPIPAWVIIKTQAEIRFNPLRRNWRRNNLKV